MQDTVEKDVFHLVSEIMIPKHAKTIVWILIPMQMLNILIDFVSISAPLHRLINTIEIITPKHVLYQLIAKTITLQTTQLGNV